MKMMKFYWQVIYNFFALVEKYIMCHNIILKNIFDARTGHSIYCSFSMTSCTTCTHGSQVELLSEFLEKRESIFVFVLCGSISLWIHKSWYVIFNDDITKHMIEKHWNMDGVITQMKIISGTNRINYRTVESELFSQKTSWLDFIFRLQCKILWKIKLIVLVIACFFHQRNYHSLGHVDRFMKVDTGYWN